MGEDAECRFGHKEPRGETSSREDQEGTRGQVSLRGQTGRMGLGVPAVTAPLPLSPYLLPFHSRKTRGSIKSRLSLRALRNIKDNQPAISLISINYRPFLEKEARAEKTQRVRPVGLKPRVSL